MKILLVEDHAFQQKLLLSQLENLCYAFDDQIGAASSAREALEYIEQDQPDLLFCDLNMPEMDGIRFLAHLAEQKFPGFIVITSAAPPETLKSVEKMCRTYRLNLLGSVAKPARDDVLSEFINTARERIAEDGEPSFVTPLTSSSLTEDDLNLAIKNKWLQPYFQPIVSLHTGEWKRCEALIRLVHPTHGVVAPHRFLPKLSTMGKDAYLTLLAIKHVINNQNQLCHREVAINLTAVTLTTAGFVDTVISLLKQYPKLNQQLHFELTESDAIDDTGEALQAASRLSMHKFKLSLDDFGTGYSSLKQLDLLPFSTLKLDMSFVQAMPSSNTAKAIVEASLLLSDRLSLTSVAEGIEDVDTWLQLQQMGCDLGQGYFIAPPMPVTQLSIWHDSWQERCTQPQLSAENQEALLTN